MLDRKTVLVLAVAFAAGYFLATRTDNSPPKPDRPAVRWIVRAAKSFLWLAAFADPPPEPARRDQRLVQAPVIGEDGYPVVDHGKGL
jgi:hypothetical protein